ncbi:hypothetical protein EMPS_01917 [Entomortierella parvispora]|uniref:Homeobox domain-containing protein n=1 Tax=Entomortierella parvispora TaxID=205924 RepID=A0A9P3H3Q8_9FUNG|nr:hypothetical protein EMPS_01917 [Entomortierella parvispora]
MLRAQTLPRTSTHPTTASPFARPSLKTSPKPSSPLSPTPSFIPSPRAQSPGAGGHNVAHSPTFDWCGIESNCMAKSPQLSYKPTPDSSFDSFPIKGQAIRRSSPHPPLHRTPSPPVRTLEPFSSGDKMVVGETKENSDETVDHGTFKHRQQSTHSRIHISNLLCAVDAVSPPPSTTTATSTPAPWDSRAHPNDPRAVQKNVDPRAVQENVPPPKHYEHNHNNRRHSQQETTTLDHQRSSPEPSWSHQQPWRPTSGAPTPSPSSRSGQSFGESPAYHAGHHEIASTSSHQRQYSYPTREPGPLDRFTPPPPPYQEHGQQRRPSDYGRADFGYNREQTMTGEPLSSTQRSTHSYSVSHFATRPAGGPAGTQRSASMSVIPYHGESYPYPPVRDQAPSLEQRRTEQSRRDYALHQQNYGPYLDASPTQEHAPLLSGTRPSIQPHHPSHPQEYQSPRSPPMSAMHSPPSLYYDRERPSESTRMVGSPLYQSHTARGSFQSEHRRPSHGSVLPSPHPSENFALAAPPKRVYGLDAADAPLPPPLAPSAAFGSRPLHNIPDEREPPEFSQRPTAPYSYSHQDSYERRPSQAQAAYEDDRRDSGPRGSWTRDSSYSRPSDRSRQSIGDPSGYSPTSDPQPPSWYQHYAHAVPLKHPQGQQQRRPSYSSSSSALPRRESEYGGVSRPEASLDSSDQQSRAYGTGSLASVGTGNRRPSGAVGQDMTASTATESTTRASVSHSVHPFDMGASSSGVTSPKEVSPKSENASKPIWSSALGKRDRGVGGQDVDPFVPDDGVKAKRKRANPEQLSVLNAAFERSYFPSTEERHRLSKLTNMCPRTVQIWFQNKRQSVKARTEAMDIAVSNHNGNGGTSNLERRRRGSMAQERAREEQHYQQQQQQNNATLTSERRRTVSHDSHRPTRGEIALDHPSTSSSSPRNNAPLHHHPQEPRYHHQPYHPEHPHPHSSHSYSQHSSQSQSQFQPRSSPQSPLRQSITNASAAGSSDAAMPTLLRGEKRRNSGPLTPSDASIVALQIQPDDRTVDYFSRKRRATIARMEHPQQSH